MQLRARREEDKNARRRAILDAALAVWSVSSYADFTMSAVAGRAGVAKGTLYLYFATKEELLLELLEELLGGWIDDLDRRLLERRGPWSPEEAARAMGRSLEGREPLVRLLTTSGGILEHNIGDARARRFKEMIRSRALRTGGLLAERLPIAPESAMRLPFQAYALLTGFGEMAYPAPVVRRLLQEPGFEMFRIDAAGETERAILALLRGLVAARPAGAPPGGRARGRGSRRTPR